MATLPTRPPADARSARWGLAGTPAVPSDGFRRSLSEVSGPLDLLASGSPHLIARHDARFEVEGESYELPRYLFAGPPGGDDPLRIGLFAGIHGDEPEGSRALVQLLKVLAAKPDLAAGYCLFVYPVCNPTGFEDGTRCSRRGQDLNREFWNHSREPEVQLLQAELVSHCFHGIVSLHTDDTSDGFYGFAHGATLTQNLIEPALQAVGHLLPRNRDAVIDGFSAENGIIRDGYQGILCAPPRVRPRPFEIILETPKSPPDHIKETALVVALQSILAEYRKLVAYAPNL